MTAHACAGAVCRVCGPGVSGSAAATAGTALAAGAAPSWTERALAWITAQPAGSPLTSEDVTHALGLPSGSVGTNRNNAVGAVMRAAARAGLLERRGYIAASRAESHGAVLALWIRTGGSPWEGERLW